MRAPIIRAWKGPVDAVLSPTMRRCLAVMLDARPEPIVPAAGRGWTVAGRTFEHVTVAALVKRGALVLRRGGFGLAGVPVPRFRRAA